MIAWLVFLFLSVSAFALPSMDDCEGVLAARPLQVYDISGKDAYQVFFKAIKSTDQTRASIVRYPKTTSYVLMRIPNFKLSPYPITWKTDSWVEFMESRSQWNNRTIYGFKADAGYFVLLSRQHFIQSIKKAASEVKKETRASLVRADEIRPTKTTVTPVDLNLFKNGDVSFAAARISENFSVKDALGILKSRYRLAMWNPREQVYQTLYFDFLKNTTYQIDFIVSSSKSTAIVHLKGMKALNAREQRAFFRNYVIAGKYVDRHLSIPFSKVTLPDGETIRGIDIPAVISAKLKVKHGIELRDAENMLRRLKKVWPVRHHDFSAVLHWRDKEYLAFFGHHKTGQLDLKTLYSSR